MTTTDIPAIEIPAIPRQYANSLNEAITFAQKARRGACANRDHWALIGTNHGATIKADADVEAIDALLLNLLKQSDDVIKAQLRPGHVVEFKWDEICGDWWVYVDGFAEVFAPTRELAQVKLNEWFDHERTVERKRAQLHGIQPSITTPADLVASLGEDDDPITDDEIAAEFEHMSRGEMPAAKQSTATPWTKALGSFHGAARRNGVVATGRDETDEQRAKRLAVCGIWINRPITSCRDMNVDELLSCTEALCQGEITGCWELSQWAVLPMNAQHVAA